jgi:excisionase family DNA binding protein
MGPRLVTAAELVAHPERITELEPSVGRLILAQLTTVSAALAVRLLESPSDSSSKLRAEAGDLLRIEDAAKRMNVSKTWLYRRVEQLPFVIRLGRGVRVSADGLERYLRAQRSR